MIIRIIFFVALVLGSSISSFAQDNITRDADGNLWLITDTIQGCTYYIDNNGNNNITFTWSSQLMQTSTETTSCQSV